MKIKFTFDKPSHLTRWDRPSTASKFADILRARLTNAVIFTFGPDVFVQLNESSKIDETQIIRNAGTDTDAETIAFYEIQTWTRKNWKKAQPSMTGEY